jgi:hypothetical protein
MKNSNNTGSKQRIKPLTNLQKRKRREKSQHYTRVRKTKKHPLCISKGFIKYAYQKRWDNVTVDAAAWVMHYWFLRRKRFNDNGWVPIPYQVFKAMFGKGYKRIVDYLVDVGFLERDEIRGSKKGSHCCNYRVCEELRNDEITASHRLQSKGILERFIEYKKYWAGVSEARRKERAAATIDAAFYIPDFTDANDHANSYYYLVKEGHLTLGQFKTIERLAENAFKLRVQIDSADFMALAKRQYEKNKITKKIKCDFDAYVQLLQGKIDRTSRQKIKIDKYGRFHVPMTNLVRGLWDYVSFKKQPLVAVDIKTSHVVCILALLKDIEIHYFGGTGLHEERLARCQFSRQIAMIPGLAEHLRQVSGIYQACGYFQFKGSIPDDISERRKMMHSLFIRFTKRHAKDVGSVNHYYYVRHTNKFIQVDLEQHLLEIYFRNNDSFNSNNT